MVYLREYQHCGTLFCLVYKPSFKPWFLLLVRIILLRWDNADQKTFTSQFARTIVFHLSRSPYIYYWKWTLNERYENPMHDCVLIVRFCNICQSHRIRLMKVCTQGWHILHLLATSICSNEDGVLTVAANELCCCMKSVNNITLYNRSVSINTIFFNF